MTRWAAEGISCRRATIRARMPGPAVAAYSMSMTGEVSPLGRGDEVAPPGDLRASHEDRDRVVELLRVAAGDGRLTAEELDERLEAALTARTYGELAVLIRDLPAAPGFAPPTQVSGPKDLVRIDCRSGSAKRDGRWVVPQRMEVQVTRGIGTRDGTAAVTVQPDLPIDAGERTGGRHAPPTAPRSCRPTW